LKEGETIDLFKNIWVTSYKKQVTRKFVICNS
jgi:hypothetical protein